MEALTLDCAADHAIVDYLFVLCFPPCHSNHASLSFSPFSSALLLLNFSCQPVFRHFYSLLLFFSNEGKSSRVKHVVQLLGFVCCLIFFVIGARALDFPATVEVDSVFPRNDTYAPVPLIPIVVAIQDSRFA